MNLATCPKPIEGPTLGYPSSTLVKLPTVLGLTLEFDSLTNKVLINDMTSQVTQAPQQPLNYPSFLELTPRTKEHDQGLAPLACMLHQTQCTDKPGVQAIPAEGFAIFSESYSPDPHSKNPYSNQTSSTEERYMQAIPAYANLTSKRSAEPAFNGNLLSQRTFNSSLRSNRPGPNPWRGTHFIAEHTPTKNFTGIYFDLTPAELAAYFLCLCFLVTT